MDLPDNIRAVLQDLEYDTPTDIQASTIPALLEGRDLVGVAQTGTGKTAAFGLPMLAGIDPAKSAVQALVLTPTRELAIQVASAIEQFGGLTAGLRVAAVYGGAAYGPQLRDLAAGAQVVVGTPGRVIDHLERGRLDLTELRFLVLDEADEMLRMGFAEDVETILSQAPTERQTALFSATMPPAIRQTAGRHLRDPLHISVAERSAPPDAVEQFYAIVPFRYKVPALARLLAATSAEAVIVFVRTRADVDDVAQALLERGVNAAGLSGDVAQRERERIVERLRQGQLDVLVATDVAARGLDVGRVGLVVNFDMPRQAEPYVHRIGRTGRAGRSGVAFTMVTPSERGRLHAIEREIGVALKQQAIPTASQIAEQLYARVLARVGKRLVAGLLSPAYRAVAEAIEAGADPVALAAAAAALAANDWPATTTGPNQDDELDEALAACAADPRQGRKRSREAIPARQAKAGRGAAKRPHQTRLTAQPDDQRPTWHDNGGPRDGRPTNRPAVAQRYWIGVGHEHGVRPGAIVGAITGETKLRGTDLGRIEVFKHFSLVEIEADLSRDTMRHLAKTRVAGRALRIRPDFGG
ncbi:MAG: DEAD/DEAH box helicase [Bifidobacteriaceae bacterium]|nr:DEAD/DEAH box helicase [Bifidobacteriaceae bacterium]